ncbi:MAG TPA: hypothetical protein PLO93_04510, partial [Candidatus Omnitrophota bacterium]|nr:hypothetical protein [Candidatus Omnitrophota bacterium]
RGVYESLEENAEDYRQGLAQHTVQGLIDNGIMKAYSKKSKEFLNVQNANIWNDLARIGVAPKTRPIVVRFTPRLLLTDKDGTTDYTTKTGRPTYQYLQPNDARGRSLAIAYPDGNLELNFWWMEAETKHVTNGNQHEVYMRPGILPGHMLIGEDGKFKAFEIYKGVRPEVSQNNDISWQDQQENVFVMSRSEDQRFVLTVTTPGKDTISMKGNEYHVLGEPYRREIVFSAAGQLLAEKYSFMRMQVMKENFGVAVKDVETTLYDITSNYRKPVVSFLDDGTITKDYLKIVFSIEEKNGIYYQRTIVLVNETEGLDVSKINLQEYSYLDGKMVNKERPSLFMSWLEKAAAWRNIGLVLFGYIFGTLALGKILAWIGQAMRARRSRRQGLDEVVLQLSKETIQKILDEVQAYSDYGFQIGVVKVVKEQLVALLNRRLSAGEKLSDITTEYFSRFKNVWFTPVMKKVLSAEEFKIWIERIDQFGVHEIYIYMLTNTAGGKLANVTASVDFFNFYRGVKLLRSGDDHFGASIEQDVSMWDKIILLHGAGSDKYQKIHHDDIEGYFWTPGFITFYENGGRDQIWNLLTDDEKNSYEIDPPAKGGRKGILTVDNILRKVYPDIKTSKWGILGWIRVNISFNRILAVVLGVSALSSLGLIFAPATMSFTAVTGPFAIIAGTVAIIGIAYGVMVWVDKKNQQKLQTKDVYGESVSPDTWAKNNPVKGTATRKARATVVMVVTLLMKLGADFITWHWLSGALNIIHGSTWITAYGAMFGGPYILLAVVVSLFFLIFFLDIFACYYIVEGALGHWIAKFEGVNRVNAWNNRSWKSISGFFFSTVSFLGIVSLIPGVNVVTGIAVAVSIPKFWAFLATGAAITLFVLVIDAALKAFGAERIMGESVRGSFKRASQYFAEKILPASIVGVDGQRRPMTKTE